MIEPGNDFFEDHKPQFHPEQLPTMKELEARHLPEIQTEEEDLRKIVNEALCDSVKLFRDVLKDTDLKMETRIKAATNIVALAVDKKGPSPFQVQNEEQSLAHMIAESLRSGKTPNYTPDVSSD